MAKTNLASLNANRSWTLNIFVTDLNMQKNIEVNGQTHVGQVMLDLVDKLDVTTDWSDHGLWWPEKKIWLLKARLTLATAGILGDTQLQFTPMHKMVRLQMPDLQEFQMRLSFSLNVFNAVKEICAELGIRHPEELSLLRPPESGTKKRENKKKKNKDGSHTGSVGSDDTASQGSMGNGTLGHHTPLSPGRTPGSPGSNKGSDFSYSTGSDTLNPYLTAMSPMLTHSPQRVSAEVLESVGRGKNITERSNLNIGWLSSSESLMEQDVKEMDHLMLRFKYYNFFDLNPKIDEVRINQIYEQAKYQILSEEVDCTEEESITFGALMFQVKVGGNKPAANDETDGDDIDAALNELAMTLEGTTKPLNDVSQPSAHRPTLTHIPEMKESLSLVKKKSFGMHSVKSYDFVFKDTHISWSKSDSKGPDLGKHNLKGCEVTPDVNISKDRYHIKLRIPDGDIIELELSCNSQEQYIKWMAACRLASKGKSMADPTYEMEMSGVKTFLAMQSDSNNKDDSILNDSEHSQIQAEDFVPQKMLNKYKSKQIAARVLEAHSSFTKLTLQEAKMNYIRQWMALPDFGITTFNCKFRESKKKQEIVGIATNRIVRMEVSSRDTIKQWRYSTMKQWDVNWETREMIINCEGDNFIFSCIGCDVRIVHEFIGGYIFLSMRKDVNAPLDDELFYKMTASGWYH